MKWPWIYWLTSKFNRFNKGDIQRLDSRGNLMPHEHVPLAQAPNGEIGPKCHGCNTRLTFGSAMVHAQHYMCWECYVKTTGSDAATDTSIESKPFWQE